MVSGGGLYVSGSIWARCDRRTMRVEIPRCPFTSRPIMQSPSAGPASSSPTADPLPDPFAIYQSSLDPPHVDERFQQPAAVPQPPDTPLPMLNTPRHPGEFPVVDYDPTPFSAVTRVGAAAGQVAQDASDEVARRLQVRLHHFGAEFPSFAASPTLTPMVWQQSPYQFDGMGPVRDMGTDPATPYRARNVTGFKRAAPTATTPPADADARRKKQRSRLPPAAIAIMQNWFMDHLGKPYPTDEEKKVIAEQTNLSVAQVVNWFTNTRKRLWIPNRERFVAQAQRMQQREAAASGDDTPLDTTIASGSI
ncbi:Homeobox domain-containing protein [Plasmodiophora brassicae]